jgi:uncharacterized protein
MNCPIDGSELKISERQGIEIDYCPQCRGVWLDRGELDKLIERSGAATMPVAPPQVQQAPPPQYPQGERRDWDDDDDDYRRQGGQYPPKKRKSFLGDIFDF